MRSMIIMVTVATRIIRAETAAIIGSMDSLAYIYMRTGSVTVDGEVTKIDMVSSSNELMKASSQPPDRPGTSNGKVTRRNTVHSPAPSVRAAFSALRSMLPSEARIRRSA